MKKVVIFGAGVAGQDILGEIRKNRDLNLKVIGFLDDDPKVQNTNILKVKVLGGRQQFSQIINKRQIDEVIIAIPSAEGEQISEVVRLCSQAKVSFRIVPRVKEIIEGQAHLSTLRDVQVEDLLGRPVVKSDVQELKRFFASKKVMITGAAGSIGSELSRQISAYKPNKMIFFDWWENGLFELQIELTKDYPQLSSEYIIGNMQDTKKVKNVISRTKPDYIFHAAAYKHVPLMEDNPEEAVKNNIFGTLNVARAAVANKVKRFVIVSTDKAAHPVNVMGITKLVTEGIGKLLNGKTKFMAVRFGNVLGSYGSVIPIFKKQIEQGGPVTITDEHMTRFFMTIPEAAQLILKAASLGKGGELFVLDMGEPVKITDLAESLIRLSGLIPGQDIKVIFTGVRKGEKIEERLFSDSEQNLSHKSDRIYITQSLGLDLNKLKVSLPKLKQLSVTGQRTKIIAELKNLVFSFSR